MPVEQAPDGALGHRQPIYRVQMLGKLAQGDIRRLFDPRQDLPGMDLNPVRAVIPALPPWPDIARPLPLIDPFDRRRCRNSKALRR